MQIFFQKDPHCVQRQGNMVTDRQLGFIYGHFDLDILDWKSKCRKSLHNHSINLVYNVPISVLYLYSSVMFVCAKQCSLPPAHAPPSVGGLVATWRVGAGSTHLILWSVSNFPALVSAAGWVPRLSVAGAGDLAGLWWPPWAGPRPRGRRTIILPSPSHLRPHSHYLISLASRHWTGFQ